MQTHAAATSSFDRFDLSRVPSPCFVVDEAAVERNLRILRDVADRSGARVLLALKAFAMWRLGGLVGRYLHGTCASGLWEARLASAHFAGELTSYAPAYKADELAELLRLSDSVIFNTPAQIARFQPLIDAARAGGHRPHIGLRLNPEVSVVETPRYDPCQPSSRLGFPLSQLRTEHLAGVDGLHVHALCEQDAAPLHRVWAALEPVVAAAAGRLRWINLGGGHHITRADYDRDDLVALLRHIRERHGVAVKIEPGEAVALDAGILVGEVLDVFTNAMRVAITDISAVCHMPDVIEAPYRPRLLGEPDAGEVVRLGGPSCLAGDTIGDYRFAGRPVPGTRVAFLDQAHYSMVKTNSFNGVPLPAIALWNSDTDALELVRRFGWRDFESRLS